MIKTHFPRPVGGASPTTARGNKKTQFSTTGLYDNL
jgi:hypothetical protein